MMITALVVLLIFALLFVASAGVYAALEIDSPMLFTLADKEGMPMWVQVLLHKPALAAYYVWLLVMFYFRYGNDEIVPGKR